MLTAWFVKITESPWGKFGIEQAAVYAADKPTLVSGGVSGVGENVERVFEQKIKGGLEMKFPKPGEDM